MKILSYSKSGRLLKSRKTSRRREKVKWGAIEVPRDTGSQWMRRPYPDEVPGSTMRKYRASSGESPKRGPKVKPTGTHTKAVVKTIKTGPVLKKRKRVTHKAFSLAALKRGGLM